MSTFSVQKLEENVKICLEQQKTLKKEIQDINQRNTQLTQKVNSLEQQVDKHKIGTENDTDVALSICTLENTSKSSTKQTVADSGDELAKVHAASGEALKESLLAQKFKKLLGLETTLTEEEVHEHAVSHLNNLYTRQKELTAELDLYKQVAQKNSPARPKTRSHSAYGSKKDPQAYMTLMDYETSHLKEEKSSVELKLTCLERKNQKLQLQCQEMETKLREYTESWGKQLSRRASADDSRRENLSTRCTPMFVAEEYKNICNRFSVADILEKSRFLQSYTRAIEQVASDLTCSTFEVTSQVFRETHAELHGWLRGIFEEPIRHVSEAKIKQAVRSTRRTPRHKTFPEVNEDDHNENLRKAQEEEVLCTLDAHYRGNWPSDVTVLIDYVSEEIVQKCSRSYPDLRHILTRVFDLPEMREFVSSVCHLCWSMALMHPPMRFVQPGVGAAFDDRHQMAYMGSQCSPKKPGAVVLFYMYPTLIHKDHVHERGNVMVGVPYTQSQSYVLP